MVVKMLNKILEIKDLTVSFKSSDVPAIRELNLEVFEKDKIAIIGESGSGKSVLILSILRLLDGVKTNGEIIYNNTNLLNLKESELNRIRGNEISYVPQSSGNSLNPLMKIGHQIGEPLVIHRGYDKKNAFFKAIESMRYFNIGNEKKRANQYPHTFSGGMKQRAMISMGIISGAKLILADEPTKGLDSQRIVLIENSLKKLEDNAYILVTHDLNFARNVSKRICIMYSSYLVEEGLTHEVLNNPLHPYTEAMLNALPENGLNVSSHEFSIDTSLEGCSYKNNCPYRMDICDKTPPDYKINDRKVRCFKYA